MVVVTPNFVSIPQRNRFSYRFTSFLICGAVNSKHHPHLKVPIVTMLNSCVSCLMPLSQQCNEQNNKQFFSDISFYQTKKSEIF
jgi:hypothetical protein